MKKAQGISVTTIIIAAIALITLVVLVAIFSGYFGGWGKKVSELGENSCEPAYICVKKECGSDQVPVYGLTCAKGKVCCRPS